MDGRGARKQQQQQQQVKRPIDIHRCRFVDYIAPSVTSLQFSHSSNTKHPVPQDLRLACGRSNGDIEIWNPRHNWVLEQTLKGGENRSIEGIVWCTREEGQMRLFSYGSSSYVTEWDLEGGGSAVQVTRLERRCCLVFGAVS